jgi:hypothetical protein
MFNSSVGLSQEASTKLLGGVSILSSTAAASGGNSNRGLDPPATEANRFFSVGFVEASGNCSSSYSLNSYSSAYNF